MTRASSQEAFNAARVGQQGEKLKFFHLASSYITWRSAYNPNRTRWPPVEEAKNSPAHQDLIMRDWRRAEWSVLVKKKVFLQMRYLTETKMSSE